MITKNFRKDINGLRAVAVLTVLFFHICTFNTFNNTSLAFDVGGGYVGVDIFFVISGFLMTSIIIKGITDNNFSVWNFWKRRAKRICPALLVAVAIFFIVGFFLLVNVKEFYEYNKEAQDALLFISNFRFARSEGYFAVDSMSKMLLHTWSLSVEWQFYVVYPILIALINKFFGLKAVKYTIVGLFVLSLVSAFIFTSESNYYMLYTRAWELLAGALVFLFPINKILKSSTSKKSILEVIGLVLILLIFYRTDNAVWTAGVVIPAVIGSMLILSCANEKSILSNVVFQYLGKISYSLYIYHWLVLSVLARIELVDNMLIAGTLILVLSILSYHFIESSRNYGWKFLIVYIAVFGCILFTIDKKGFDSRYTIEIPFGGEGVADFAVGYNNPDNEADVVLIGDSHAKHLMHYMDSHNIKAGILANSGTFCFDVAHCRVAKGNRFMKDITDNYGSVKNYIDYKTEFMNSIKPNVPIILSQRWIQHFDEDVKDWSKSDFSKNDVLDPSLGTIFNTYKDHHFYVLGSMIGSHSIDTIRECNNIKTLNKYLPKSVLDRMHCSLPKLQLDKKYVVLNDYLSKYLKKYSNVTFIDPNAILCKDGYCNLVTEYGEQIFWDDNHLSFVGSDLIGSYIFNIINKTE